MDGNRLPPCSLTFIPAADCSTDFEFPSPSNLVIWVSKFNDLLLLHCLRIQKKKLFQTSFACWMKTWRDYWIKTEPEKKPSFLNTSVVSIGLRHHMFSLKFRFKNLTWRDPVGEFCLDPRLLVLQTSWCDWQVSKATMHVDKISSSLCLSEFWLYKKTFWYFHWVGPTSISKKSYLYLKDSERGSWGWSRRV